MPTLKLRNMVEFEDDTEAGTIPRSDIVIDELGDPEQIRDQEALAQQATFAIRTRLRPSGEFGSDIHLLRGQKQESVVKPFGLFTAVSSLVNLKRIQDKYIRDFPNHPLTEVIQTVTNMSINTKDKVRVVVKATVVSEQDRTVSVTSGA